MNGLFNGWSCGCVRGGAWAEQRWDDVGAVQRLSCGGAGGRAGLGWRCAAPTVDCRYCTVKTYCSSSRAIGGSGHVREWHVIGY